MAGVAYVIFGRLEKAVARFLFFFPRLIEMAQQSTLIVECVCRSCSNNGFEVMGEALPQVSAQVPSLYPA